MAGPSANLKLSANVSAAGQSREITDVTDFDFSTIVGAGAAYKFTGNDKVFVDVRYNLGLIKANTTGTNNITLNQLAFNLGYIKTFGGSK